MARPDIEELRDLIQRHCVRFGDFTLASGRKSKYYYNGKRITLRPPALRLIGDVLVDIVLAAGAEAVGGPELGAVPIAASVGFAALARGRDLPIFVVRKEQKQHGARDLIVEPYADEADNSSAERPLITEGRRVAIVEDAVTTGGSVQKAIDAVEELGGRIVLIAVLVERTRAAGMACAAGVTTCCRSFGPMRRAGFTSTKSSCAGSKRPPLRRLSSVMATR